MKAIVVEGGAMRGIFAAGVLDAHIEADFYPYDFAIGVSAGTSNLANYLSKQHKRSYDVITKLATQKQFFNPIRFIKKGHLVDIQWLLNESERVYPLNKKQLFSSIPLFTSITNIATGHAEYYRIDHKNINYLLEATSAMPIAYRSTPCTPESCHADGGISDSIPVIEAYKRGATDITVILSRPLNYRMQQKKVNWAMKTMLNQQPRIIQALSTRAIHYNKALDFIKSPPEGVSVNVLAPPSHFPINRLTMDRKKLETGYQMGLVLGYQQIQKHLQQLLTHGSLDRSSGTGVPIQ
ncbi:patatin-like phospholipase family protein [Vibrio caribbeanicus]|uniref:Phospholipase n=1 Tax=Vibrio caribbeanicus ATCC BAA-2122 TaxID=796620 RepID=E3BL48_9VIBR|nr:patatin family protein [Vibrio caribbeanicus]EFP96392.1 Phospholipase [Vibrio caribbeanicus ATCC BAA-2122]